MSNPRMICTADQESRAANVGSAAESDAEARISEHLEAREGEGSGELLYVGDTPAGGAGPTRVPPPQWASTMPRRMRRSRKPGRTVRSTMNEPGIGNRPGEASD